MVLTIAGQAMPSETTTLAQRVEGAIVANPFFSGRRWRFEAEEGRVVLSGSVSTYFQKQMAQEIIRRVEGVEEIDNGLEVHWPTEREDRLVCLAR
jgi:osmotically-inducible protein OsmY